MDTPSIRVNSGQKRFGLVGRDLELRIVAVRAVLGPVVDDAGAACPVYEATDTSTSRGPG